MKRADLTEKILDIKREKGWSWKHITTEIGGMSEVLVVGALLGQMKLTKPLVAKAVELFGLSEAEGRMLNEVPMRGMPMPPTDPLQGRLRTCRAGVGRRGRWARERRRRIVLSQDCLAPLPANRLNSASGRLAPTGGSILPAGKDRTRAEAALLEALE